MLRAHGCRSGGEIDGELSLGVCFMAQKKRKSIMDKRRGCGNLEIALGR